MTSHRIIFIRRADPTPIDLVRHALDQKIAADDAEAQLRATQALSRLANCLSDLLAACEKEATDTEKIALVEAALVKLLL